MIIWHIRVALAIGILVGVPLLRASSVVSQVDQENWNIGSGQGQINWNGTLKLEQEFTPELDALDSVELWMPPFGILNPAFGSGVTAVMNIHQGGVDGPIIAISAPAYGAPSGGGIVFGFREQVRLTPGQLYAFEPIVLQGNTFFTTTWAAYPHGRLYVIDAFTDGSLAFREGIGIPEPTPLFLLLLGASVLAIRTKREQKYRTRLLQ